MLLGTVDERRYRFPFCLMHLGVVSNRGLSCSMFCWQLPYLAGQSFVMLPSRFDRTTQLMVFDCGTGHFKQLMLFIGHGVGRLSAISFRVLPYGFPLVLLRA